MIYKLFKRIIYKLARRKFVWNFDKFCTNKIGRILLFNKTEEYYLHGFFQNFSHPNNWESYEMGKILNKLGFVVDVIDRTATLKDIEKIKDKYDIFIGLGAGDQGKYFPDIAERVPSAVRVLYAMGPEPDLSDKVTRERHDYFRKRHPEFPVIDRRLVSSVDTKRLYRVTDSIISIGNDWSYGSYKHLGKDLYKIYLSTYSKLSTTEEELEKKDKNKFLYFAGNGNIAKGLDLVLEVFAKRSDLELFIGGPDNEEDFNAYAKTIIDSSPNIKHLGFMDITKEKFKQVTNKCAYVIMPSASEGAATSITTCMRRGLVPIVTIETGIERVEDFGYLIPEGTLESLEKTVDLVAQTNKNEFIEKAKKTYKESFKYTEEAFKKSFEAVIKEIMKKKNL